MSPRTQHHRGTVLRTALATLVLLLAASLANARERALYLQLQDAPEDALSGLLERMASARPEGETRVPATQAVAKLLERGHGDAVTDRALESLGAWGTAQAGGVLSQYSSHRRPGARARAFTALGRVAGSDRALRELVANGLRDSVPEVRGASARALEVLRASEATPLLLRALGRGVPEAAVTLGAIGDAGSLEGYNAYLRQQPLDVMLSGYDRYLKRTDLNERLKLDIVARLEDVSGPAVLRFVSGVARSPQLPASVREAASAAALRIAKAQNAPAAQPAKPGPAKLGVSGRPVQPAQPAAAPAGPRTQPAAGVKP
jgi:hypothetical protein